MAEQDSTYGALFSGLYYSLLVSRMSMRFMGSKEARLEYGSLGSQSQHCSNGTGVSNAPSCRNRYRGHGIYHTRYQYQR